MLHWLSQFENELYVFLISMIPIIELRGAVPVAAGLGLKWYNAFWISVVGNSIIVPFVVLLGREIIMIGKKLKFTSKLFHAIEKRTLAKQDLINKYSIPGLIIFVGIPLPGTGAWTGALLASLLNLRVKDAMWSCFAGTALAGVVVTLVTYGVASIF